MSSRRRHVMNDDILGLIFKDLDLKDMFALQRVSQQFSRCSQQVLQRKRRISIGFSGLKTDSPLRYFNENFNVNDWNRVDITPAITISMKGIDLTLGSRLESIVRQIRGVKYLYLSSTVISFKTLELFITQWPQLQSLYINDIEFLVSSESLTEWTQLMAKVKYIYIRHIYGKYLPFLRNIIQEMSSLQALRVSGFWTNISNQEITLSLLNRLSGNMQYLNIGLSSKDSQAIDVITSKCPQLKKLTIYGQSVDLWNQWFAMICERLKCLTHLSTCLGDISAKDFAQSIAKLKDIKVLEIVSYGLILQEKPIMCFDTQEMAKYMQPMVSLKTVCLYGLKCSSNRWSNMAQMLPNVRKFRVNYIYYWTDCKDGKDCNLCVYRCMDLVLKLPKLKHIIISCSTNGYLSRHILELFAGVDRLTIGSIVDDLIEMLVYFLTQTLAKRQRVFRLDLLPKIKRQLIQRMDTMNVSMPECVIIGHVFSTRNECQ